MSSETTPKGRTIRVARVVPATPDIIFKAWTDPAIAKTWWGKSENGKVETCEIDARVGGDFRYKVRVPDRGDPDPAQGHFIEMSPPRRMVFSWSCGSGEDVARDTKVSLDIVDLRDGSSRVSVVQERLPTPRIAAIHQAAWSDVLQDLAVHLSA